MKKLLIIVTFVNCLYSYTFELEKKELFTSSDGYHFITYVDWDRDGLKDILETELCINGRDDKLLFKKNIGTAHSPIYSTGEYILDENGEELAFPHG